MTGRLMSRITTAAIAALLLTHPAAAQESPLGGVWALSRTLSQLPSEIGFNVNWVPPPDNGKESGSSSGGGGRRGASGSAGGGRGSATPFSAPRESLEDSQRMQLVTSQARNPPVRMTIVDYPAAITITTELGQSRTLHPNAMDEWVQIEGVAIRVNTRRDAERVVIVYHVETNRDVRYTLTPSRDPKQLIVDVEFIERGTTGDKARLVYQPGLSTDTATATPLAPAPPSPAGTPAVPGAAGQPSDKFDARPGAELRGLKSLGVLVEDLGSQATTCGLNRDAIEQAVSARLTTAGFSVRKNSDDDTYVYVNVMTTTVSGTCVSRYDAYLYTSATANVSYRDRPVLVQVSLIHRGGIAATAPSAHPPAVARGLESYIDVFVTQIREANK
jgi:hypothetical protein